MHLLTGMVGGDQMFAAVLDPFHRPAETLGGDADQHVLGIKLAAHAEPAADMRFVYMNRARRQRQHPRQEFLIAVRDFRRAVQFQHAVRGIITPDRAAGFERHAGMPADSQIQFDNVRGLAERLLDVAIALADHRGFARMAGRKFDRRRLRVDDRRQVFDLDRDQIGGVLGDVWIYGEHCGDRVADIAHAALRQHRLAVGIERRDRAFAKIDRRHLGYVFGSPHREHARQPAGRRGIDVRDGAVGMSGAHDPHGELVREIDIAGELAMAGDERRILQPRDRLPDPGCFCCGQIHPAARSSARRATASTRSRRNSAVLMMSSIGSTAAIAAWAAARNA